MLFSSTHTSQAPAPCLYAHPEPGTAVPRRTQGPEAVRPTFCESWGQTVGSPHSELLRLILTNTRSLTQSTQQRCRVSAISMATPQMRRLRLTKEKIAEEKEGPGFKSRSAWLQTTVRPTAVDTREGPACRSTFSAPFRSLERPAPSAESAGLWGSGECQGQPSPEHPRVPDSSPTPAPSSFWHQRAENVTTDEVIPLGHGVRGERP